MKTYRRGFTLVELLVVIAIIGILVGLLLPAVQAAREAARRMQCVNSAKNISLAMHNYHDAHKRFPAGVSAWASMATGAERAGGNAGEVDGYFNGKWSWSAAILPFIEANSLYDQIDFSRRPWTEERGDPYFGDTGPDNTEYALVNQIVSSSMPSVFACPSTPQMEKGKFKDYALNAGHGQNGSTYRTSATPLNSCCPERATTGNGIAFKNSKVGMGAIPDGTSNTLMVVEQASRIPTYAYSTNPFMWTNHNSQGLSLCSQGDTYFPPNLDGALLIQSFALSGRVARGYHTGGVVASMCDGSVRFISDAIANVPWRAIHTRDGAEAVSLPD